MSGQNHKITQAKKVSSTTKGKDKGWNCKKTVLKQRMKTESRFYRTDPEAYQEARVEIGKLKGNNPV